MQYLIKFTATLRDDFKNVLFSRKLLYWSVFVRVKAVKKELLYFAKWKNPSDCNIWAFNLELKNTVSYNFEFR